MTNGPLPGHVALLRVIRPGNWKGTEPNLKPRDFIPDPSDPICYSTWLSSKHPSPESLRELADENPTWQCKPAQCGVAKVPVSALSQFGGVFAEEEADEKREGHVCVRNMATLTESDRLLLAKSFQTVVWPDRYGKAPIAGP